jgi:hypothetical protein
VNLGHGEDILCDCHYLKYAKNSIIENKIRNNKFNPKVHFDFEKRECGCFKYLEKIHINNKETAYIMFNQYDTFCNHHDESHGITFDETMFSCNFCKQELKICYYNKHVDSAKHRKTGIKISDVKWYYTYIISIMFFTILFLVIIGYLVIDAKPSLNIILLGA